MIDCFDTSVVVAAVVASHPFHAVAVQVLSEVEAGGNRPRTCSHTLAETFATLTRLPIRPRIDAAAAEVIVLREILVRYVVEAVRVEDQLAAIRAVIGAGRTGSVVHDALHVAVARRLDADRLWTFNRSHFEPLWDAEHVRVPST